MKKPETLGGGMPQEAIGERPRDVLAEREGGIEVPETAELESGREEKDQAEQERVEALREQVKRESTPRKPKEGISEYIQKYVPEHLQKPDVLARTISGLAGVAGEMLLRFQGRKIEGREHVPTDGPYILVANHTRDSDPVVTAAIAGRRVDYASTDMNFQINPALSWFFKKLGLYSVKSSLGNISTEEKAALMERVPKYPGHQRPYYQSVIDRPMDVANIRQFARETAALLARGEPVVIFPEGLWLFEGNKMREAYPGVELVLREYKRLTGKDVPILPVAISDKQVHIDELMVLGDGEEIHTVMRAIAEHLPEEERGFYSE